MASRHAPGRIAHLSTAHPPRDNRIFRKECVALAEAGFDVWFIASQNGDETVDGVHIVGVPKPASRFKRLTAAQFSAWQALGRVRPNLVHVHDPELIPLVWLWTKLRGARAVFDAHEDLAAQLAGKRYLGRLALPLAWAVARLLLLLADRGFAGIVAATPAIERLFRNPNKAVVYNYPWLRDFPADELGEPAPGEVVFAGGLSAGRMVSTMMASTRAVPGAHLTLAGPADEETAALLRDLPPGDQVTYLGRLPQREVPPLLRRASVGLVYLTPLPNHYEALPTKLFEYMAAARPFVATDFPYWREVLGDIECGLFADTTSITAPASCIQELLTNRDRARAMGEHGRSAVQERFNFESQVVTLIAITERALNGNGSARSEQ